MTELTCILCPKGCRLRVDEKNGYAVTGNPCPRGIEYGKTELTRPIRSVSSTVGITGAAHRRCPVKTDGPIPKSLVFAAVQALNGVTLSAPIQTGQVVLENICGTGRNFIATRDM